MPRSLTFGYNAALALDELVVDRFVGADYDEMLISDSFRQDFDEPEAAGTAHICLSRPHVEFDATREGRNAVLRLPLLRVVAYFTETPLGFDNPEDFSVAAAVEFSLERDPSTGDLRPNFAGTVVEDVTVACLDPDPETNPLKALLIEALMPGLIARALGGGRFDGISVPLDIDQDYLYADSADAVIFNDDDIDDRDTLNLAFYEADDDETRGRASAVPNFMEDGRTVTFLLSRAVFELMVERFLDIRFMNFDMVIAGEEYEENDIRISAPDDSGVVTITGLTNSQHARVSGRIENRTRGLSATLDTDDDGVFTVAMQASVGDVLAFSGDYFRETYSGTAIRIYLPSLSLRDGSIGITGSAWIDKLGGLDVTFDGHVYLRIDPVSGALVPSTDVSLDLPCLADFIEFLLSIFIGPFANLLFSWFEEDVEGEITGFFADSGLSLVPGLSDPDRIATFLENIEIRSNGIIVTGQMDAGWIYNAGRTAENRINLDRAAFILDPATAAVTVTNGRIGNVAGMSFEQLGPEEIRETPPESRDTLTFADLAALNGRVFAILTDQDRSAKIRVDVIDGAGPVLRWVTCNPPLPSSVEISGAWENDGEWGSDGRWSWGGADTFWGTFTAACTRLHTDAPLEITWEYSCEIYGHEGDAPAGLATLTQVGSNDLQRYLEVSTVGLEEGAIVRITLTVTVTDVFGRSAASTYRVSAEPPYRRMAVNPGPRGTGQRIDPHIPYREWGKRIDEKVAEIEKKPDKQRSRDKLEKLRDELLAMAEEVACEIESSTTTSTTVSSSARRSSRKRG